VKLTDDAVDAIAAGSRHAMDCDDQMAYTIFRDPESGMRCSIQPEHVHALALEVQSSRAKRCENCAHWLVLDEDPSQGECIPIGCQTDTTWSCGDFSKR
jgi:hypothetical protein